MGVRTLLLLFLESGAPLMGTEEGWGGEGEGGVGGLLRGQDKSSKSLTALNQSASRWRKS